MWPFGRKVKKDRPATSNLVFKNASAFFEFQCKFGHTSIRQNQGIVALVLDAKSMFGVPAAIKIQDDESQLALLKVASDDGGFIVPACTPSRNGPPLKVGDVVMWVPMAYSEEVARGLSDPRAGWVGLIRATVAPEWDPSKPEWKILSRYD